MSLLKIALLQIAPCSTRKANLEKGIEYCRRAKERVRDLRPYCRRMDEGSGSGGQ